YFCALHLSRSGLAQTLDLRRRQLAPVSRLQPAVAKGADGDAPQLVDRMTDGIAHFPHLAIASFADGDAQPTGSERNDLGRARPLTVDRHAFGQPLHVV